MTPSTHLSTLHQSLLALWLTLIAIALPSTSFAQCQFSGNQLISASGTIDLGDGNGPTPAIAIRGTVSDNGFTANGEGYTIINVIDSSLVGVYLHSQWGPGHALDFYFKNTVLGNPVPGSGPALSLSMATGCDSAAHPLPSFGGPVVLPTDGSWQHFRWSSTIGNTLAIDGPYTFTIPSGATGTLDVTDIGSPGDGYRILNHGSEIGASPDTADNLFTTSLDPTLCFQSPEWSSTSLSLDPGSYAIDIEAIRPHAFFGNGGGFLRLTLTDSPGEDTTPPSITSCPPDLTLECGDPDNTTQITAWLASFAAEDESGEPTLENDSASSQPVPGCGNTSSTLVTFTATDEAGNQSQCSATLSIVDTTPPEISSDVRDVYPYEKGLTFTVNANDLCGATDLQLASTSPDASGKGKTAQIEIVGNQVTLHQTGGVGTVITLTAVATDDCGNTIEETLRINVLRPANEGVGNGEDGDTPGHDNNGGNDDPGTGPGSPGASS